MKKWQKALLSLLSIGYLVGLALLLWPQVIVKSLAALRRIHLDIPINGQTIIDYYGLVLFSITLIIVIAILLIPTQKRDIPLRESRSGRLALSNAGITHFVQTQLSGEGLSNIKVTIKNTRRQRRFRIVADAVYQQHMVTELPRLKKTLTDKMADLFEICDNKCIEIDTDVEICL